MFIAAISAAASMPRVTTPRCRWRRYDAAIAGRFIMLRRLSEYAMLLDAAADVADYEPPCYFRRYEDFLIFRDTLPLDDAMPYAVTISITFFFLL